MTCSSFPANSYITASWQIFCNSCNQQGRAEFYQKVGLCDNPLWHQQPNIYGQESNAKQNLSSGQWDPSPRTGGRFFHRATHGGGGFLGPFGSTELSIGAMLGVSLQLCGTMQGLSWQSGTSRRVHQLSPAGKSLHGRENWWQASTACAMHHAQFQQRSLVAEYP